jgi:sensor histidine kinase YesM/ligand-binding sensor domain-containing protein
MNQKTNLYVLSLFLVFILRGYAFGQNKRIPALNDEVVLMGENNVSINPHYVHFKNLSPADGFFGNGNYRFLAKDALGYLWFWQDQEGLFRYNGLNSVVFGEAEGYLGKETRNAVQDKVGNIWFASQNGLWQFDIKTGKFNVFYNPHSSVKEFVAINTLPNGQFWVSTKLGETKTWVFDPLEKKFLHQIEAIFTLPDKTKDSTNTICIYGPIYVDKDSIAWYRGHINKSEGLCSMDLNKKTATLYRMSHMFWKDKLHPEMEGQLNYPNCVMADSDNIHIWSGGWMGGLRRFNKITKQWMQYTALNSQVKGFDTEQILSIKQKNDTELWINGFAVFNKQTETYSVFPPTQSHPFGYRGESQTTHIEKDDSDGYWACGVNVTHYSPTLQRFTVRPFPNVSDIVRIGCDDGVQKTVLIPIGGTTQNPAPSIVKYNYETKKIEQKFYPELLKMGSGEPFILKIIRSKLPSRRFWALTGNGLFELNTQTLDLVHHPLQYKNEKGEAVNFNLLFDISEDTEGGLWIGRAGFHNDGDNILLHYNPQTRQLTTYSKNKPQSQEWFTLNVINFVFCDSKGYVWLSTNDGQGLNILNPKTNIVKNYIHTPNDSTSITHNIISHFDEDKSGHVWLKTDGGFCYKTAESPVFMRISGFKGSYHNFIIDKKSNIWVGNSKGLFCYDTLTKVWRNFNEKHGIVNYANRLVISEDSSLVFSGKDIEFNPALLDIKAPPPQTVIESFNVFEKSLPLAMLPHFSEQITLKYDQNFFSIGFIGINYQNPEETQYAYQLVGVEPDWVNSGKRRTAFYTNIGAGTYEFRVKAMNSDGVWSAVKTLKIKILPPFWQTWWFRILAAGLVVAGLWFFYKNRLRQVRLEGEVKQKETELLQREAEFRRSLAETEMSALRAQMNPHFIFNCLNSINNFMLENNGKSASLYLTKFSRLIRLVLENSRTEKVSLANEMAALELYIEMESLRFKQKLRYDIQIASSVQMDFIEIPPLLLQPYVENAIWHGLMHRKEGGKVKVEVTQPLENILHIEITDDGIGRQAAMELKSRSAVRRKSFGMQITSERLQAINEIFGMETRVTVEDLQNTEGGAAGTKIVIEIPC